MLQNYVIIYRESQKTDADSGSLRFVIMSLTSRNFKANIPVLIQQYQQ